MAHIHQSLAAEAVAKHKNAVWSVCAPAPDYPVPDVAPEEKTLPRKVRSALSQLRSGYSVLLNSYKSRIDPDERNECPDCHGEPHDTAHLFACEDHPTPMDESALWLQPVAAANFLRLLGGDEDDE